jgi:predicted enzyme related to lactoylglutathione lyase
MAKNLACWWETNAEDAKPLVKFYTRVFDWEETYDESSGIWHLDSGNGTDGGIGGGIFTGKGALPPHRCLYVQVEDVDAIAERVEAEGQPILQGPFDLPSGTRLAFFRDPEGHMIGLIKPAGEKSD